MKNKKKETKAEKEKIKENEWFVNTNLIARVVYTLFYINIL